MQSLNLSKIVACPLNPLKFCIAPVVQNFAAVTRTYQLCYCYAIMEHNARNSQTVVYKDSNGQLVILEKCLQSYFPFDPYLLRRSKTKIVSLYGQYQSLPAVKEINEGQPSEVEDEIDLPDDCDEVDDFLLSDGAQSKNKLNNFDFSYSTSPGFKKSLFNL